MTVALTPVATRLPATFAIPADGEDVDSASIALTAQVLGNAIQRDSEICDAFVNGGTLNVAGLLTISTTGSGGPPHNLVLNGLALPQAGNPALFSVDGVHSLGRVRAPKATVQGAIVAGTFFYDPVSYDIVYNTAGAPAAGVVWQIGSSPANESISFYNFGTVSLDVHDPGGTLLVSLKFVSTFIYGATLTNLGGNWIMTNKIVFP